MAYRKIVHISDLHFSENKDAASLLQKNKYVSDFIDSLKDIEFLDTLIISGDIVDKGGSQRTYKLVDSFLQKIRDELNIKNILCIPGNHDVSRKLLEGISGEENVNAEKLWEQYEVKLRYYWEFVDRNNLGQYQKSGVVTYMVLHSPDMILFGVDSTDRIGTSDHCGFINVEDLAQAFKDILGEDGRNYKEYIKIAVLHHRPIIYESASQRVTQNNSSDIGQYGTCDSENWEKVKKILLTNDVHYVLTGHVHGTQSGQIRSFDSPNDKINYSTVGSIGVDFSREIRDRLDSIGDKELLSRFEELKCYGSLNGNHNAYNIWTFSDSGLVQEEQYKYIVDEGKRRWCRWTTKKFEEEIEQTDAEDVFGTGVYASPIAVEEEENYEDKILTCIREHELLKTGHYHWKNTTRLSWIDTSYFFQHREIMFNIARGINELFEKEKALKDTSCIIGLGIKGAILLSYVRFLYPDKKCSYFPENQKEHNDYEKALFEESEKMKSFVMLTDVVHSGSAVKSIANKFHDKNKEYFKVIVVTIIDATPNGTIGKEKGKYEVKLFSLARLKVIDCHGGGENCDIYTKKLANVIEYKEDQNEDH